MSIISWILIGLICGAIGRAISGSAGAGNWLGNLLLGILGAVVGGWIGGALFNVELSGFFSLSTWALAIVGSVIVLFIYNALTGKSKK